MTHVRGGFFCDEPVRGGGWVAGWLAGAGGGAVGYLVCVWGGLLAYLVGWLVGKLVCRPGLLQLIACCYSRA